MTWVLIDDHANEHPKLLQVGSEAAWLWVCGLMYCRRNKGSGGRIPAQVVRMLYPFDSCPDTLAQKLVEAGMWHPVPGGYEVHDYAEWMAKGHRSIASEDRAERRGREDEQSVSPENPTPKRVRTLSGQSQRRKPGRGPDLPDPIRSDPIRTDPVGEVVAKDLSGCGAPTTSDHDDGPSRGGDDEERETVCPLNLAEKLPPGMLSELADGHRVPLAAIERALSEFIAYWTIGGGAGRRRRNWLRQFRMRCQELARRGDLGAEAQASQPSTRRTQRRHASTDEEIEAYIASTHRESA